jgi:hypothetical protein
MSFINCLKIILFSLMCLLYISCNSDNGHANSKIPQTHTGTNKVQQHLEITRRIVDSEGEDFDSFFKKFQVDSVFQKSRIDFPLKFTISGDDGESDLIRFVPKKDLKFFGLFIANQDKGVKKKLQVSPNKVKIQFQIQDTGFEKDFNFENNNAKWRLVSVVDNSD